MYVCAYVRACVFMHVPYTINKIKFVQRTEFELILHMQDYKSAKKIIIIR